MMFTSDYFTPSDRATPEEPIPDPHHYRPDRPQSPDQPQIPPQILQSLEPQRNRRKKRRPLNRKPPRTKISVDNSNFRNEYSAIVSLGFTLIKFLFLSLAGFIVAYIFAYFLGSSMAESLLNIGSMVIMPLVGLVFCSVAIVIFLESCR